MPPPCGRGADGLGQQQAPIRGGRKQTPPAAFLDQVLVVFGRLEAQQRELEAVLAAGFAVATAAVAAELGEDGHDLIGKVDRRFVAEMDDFDLNLSGRTSGRRGRDRGCAIGQRRDEAGRVDRDNALGRDRIAGRTAQVADLPAGILAVDDELLASVAAVERDGAVDKSPGLNLHLDQLARVAEALRLRHGGRG